MAATNECSSCRSLPSFQRFLVTEEPGSGSAAVYFSADVNRCHEDLQVVLKRAAVRSMSLEVGPDRQDTGGPLIFRDTSGGGSYVLCFNFRLRDAGNIRGFRRSYGILVMVPSKRLLVELSTTLIDHAQRLAARLQVEALKTFEAETATSSSARDTLYKAQRNLADLVGRNIYSSIHIYFVQMLSKMFAARETLLVLNRQPQVNVPSCQDFDSLRRSLSRSELSLALTALATGVELRLVNKSQRDLEIVLEQLSFLRGGDPSEFGWTEVKERENDWVASTIHKGSSFHTSDPVEVGAQGEVRGFSEAPVVSSLADLIVASGSDDSNIADIKLRIVIEEFQSQGKIFRTLKANGSCEGKIFMTSDMQRFSTFSRQMKKSKVQH